VWQTRFYPELLLLPNNFERRIAIKRARRRAFSFGWRFFAAAPAIVIAILGVLRLAELARTWLPGLLLVLIVMIVNIAIPTFGWYVIWHTPFRAALRRELADLGIPICCRCGYNLSSLTEPRCPECGQPFGPKGRAP
jgi:hypothetical protein